MPRLSIIIPAAQGSQRLEDTLVAVLGNRPASCEVIVVHPGNYDDPYDLRDEVRFVEVPPKSDTARCIATAFAAAHGDVVHLLAPGTEPLEGWCEVALAHFRELKVGSVSPLIVDSPQNPTHICGVNYRAGGNRHVSRAPAGAPVNVLGPLSVGAFYRRTAIEACGGWPIDLGTRFADVDIAVSLQELGFTTVVEPRSQIAAGSSSLPSHSTFKEAQFQERLFWRHAASQGWVKSLVAHSFSVTFDLAKRLLNFSCFSAAAGRLAAIVEAPWQIQHRRLANIEAHTLGLPPYEATDDVTPDIPARQIRRAA